MTDPEIQDPDGFIYEGMLLDDIEDGDEEFWDFDDLNYEGSEVPD